jgi:cytochrome P450
LLGNGEPLIAMVDIHVDMSHALDMNDIMSPEVSFRLFDRDTWADPFPLYRALRENDPVHHVNDGDYWVLTRHRDVFPAVRDHETFSSAHGLTVEYDELERIGMADNPPMVMTDPPSHTEFRRLVSRGFTPRQVETVEPAVRAFVTEKLSTLIEDGGGDIVGTLFKPLPSMVVAHYLGVPGADRPQFDRWTDAIVAANSAGSLSDVTDAVSGMLAYFTALIDHRREHPEDDTVSHLVAAGEADDTPGLLRILAFTFTMVTGGNDTTTGLLGGGVPLLSERADQRELALADPAAAVEELLRLTSPVQGLARTTTRDVTIDEVTIPAGRKVLMCYAAANRDVEVFGPDAEELDVSRQPRQILTFSHGAHHCLGAAAARMTGRVALEELLTRVPAFSVDHDGVTWADGAYVRRPTSVPITILGTQS